MSIEEWRAVVAYEGWYEVSNQGRVRSLDRVTNDGKHLRGRVLAPFVMPSGHIRVSLARCGKSRTSKVHRLVLIAFAGMGEPGTEVCHGDGNPANNAIDNLRWGTKSENARDQITHGVHPMARKTHCPKGHPYDADNTYRRTNSNCRQCKTCVLAAQKIAYQRKMQTRKVAV